MELRHLRYFVAVAEHLHFGRAAEALATAQPSLSRQILQLEDELGVRLFERTNRHVELTDAGRRFLTDARRTLHAADAGIRHARENADGTRGELRIAFIGGAMLMALPAVLREYRRRYPNVEVTPRVMHYPEHAPALHAGNIDIAWTIPTADPDIAAQTITTDNLLAALPSDHPLSRKTIIDVADFSDETLVVLARAVSPSLYDTTLEICSTNDYHPPHVHEAHDEPTLLGLVAAGFGIALAPYPWSVIHIPGLVYREMSTNTKFYEALSWHRDRHTPIIQAFVETAMHVLATRDELIEGPTAKSPRHNP
jgi:DNA-binding transcriptional LysR family regulator